MAHQAIDFTKVNTKSYKVWRILQASGDWAQVYRDREQAYRDYKSAIIFPEQILGLNQRNIYKAHAYFVQKSVNSYITGVSCKKLNALMTREEEKSFGYPGELRSAGEVMLWESMNPHLAEHSGMYLGELSDNTHFSNNAWFSNVKDAIKYQERMFKTLVSKLG